MCCTFASLEVLAEEKKLLKSVDVFARGSVFTFLNQSWESLPVAFLTHRYDVNIMFTLILLLFSLEKLWFVLVTYYQSYMAIKVWALGQKSKNFKLSLLFLSKEVVILAVVFPLRQPARKTPFILV